MKIYFLSSRPCALMLGGVFFGMTNRFERFAEIEPKDNVFAEFIPEGALPVGFFVTEKLRFSPPEHCEVYLLRDGIAVYARDFPPSDFSLKIVAQERFGANLVTVFRQGALQISLETPAGFSVSELPEAFGKCSLRYESGLFFLEGEGMLAAFSADGKCVFSERVSAYKIENGTLTATLPLSDSRGRSAECSWALTEEGCFQTAFRIRQEGEAAKVQNELLPYAFFESVLIGANFSELLSDELKEKAEHIKAFLGDFSGVTLTKDPATCGLVHKKKERLYELRYFTVDVKDGKIADIRG